MTIETKEDLELYLKRKTEETLAEMEEIRKENGWESAEEFLKELEAAKFDPQKVYPWEKPDR
jgi:hypothetical protein